MRPIATDTADFPQMRREDKIYVDKTKYLFDIISNRDSKLFFVSRPRRFGKSLMISTLKAIFEGRRELFDGLAISQTDWQWEKWPVIHFDMSIVETDSLANFDLSFAAAVEDSLLKAGFEHDRRKTPAMNFARAIETLSGQNDGRGVAILIDEYDAPVGHCLDDIAKAESLRAKLSGLYSQMKPRTKDIRFLMMTGVSKFTKLSVFSALNNIVDISMKDDCAVMLGYSEDELSENFDSHLRAHAAKMKLEYDEYRKRMKFWYNGYRFSPGNTDTVYNPISIALTLSDKAPVFRATWATTGRPSMLMKHLERDAVLELDPEKVEGVDSSEFDVANLGNLRPIALLTQSGYLTIKDYDPIIDSYTLGVPNEEVRRDLSTLMTGVAAGQDTAWAGSLGKHLLINNWPRFFDGLKALYAAMAYGLTERSVHENSYARCLSFLLASCGFRFRMEDVQADGRADVIAEHAIGTYIFELKVNETTDAAFAQILAKGYAEPFRTSGKPIWAIALSFDSSSRRLADAAAKQI